MNPEKYCLKWNEFEENIGHSFQGLRHQQKISDVSLATDDGHQIEAHRVILSSGSDFFSDVFSKRTQINIHRHDKIISYPTMKLFLPTVLRNFIMPIRILI